MIETDEFLQGLNYSVKLLELLDYPKRNQTHLTVISKSNLLANTHAYTLIATNKRNECVCTCFYLWSYICLSVCLCVCVCSRVCACACMCKHVCLIACMFIYVRTHVYMFVYSYAYVCVYVCVYS